MKYFTIDTIKQAIEHLQGFSANWILPAFVFAANNVGTEALVDMSRSKGTDQFLDNYFNGRRIGLPPMASGNNLLRPRMKGIAWDRGPFAGDHMIRQDTKMWGNLFSSRGYREMRLEGLIDGEKAITRLTDAFQPRFEAEVPANFQFERFLTWLYAFEGIPDEIGSWQELYDKLLSDLALPNFKAPYQGRFRLSDPPIAWPEFLAVRPTDAEFIHALAPKLEEHLAMPDQLLEELQAQGTTETDVSLSSDDPVMATITAATTSGQSLCFLLAGPPGTGKTRYARYAAKTLVEQDASRTLFLQFHPAIGYDDFVEGFRPMATAEGVRYQLAPRLFLNFAQKAVATPDKKFVAVIDELNRGDVARIFGELLTYLEVDYRNVEFTLPFSGEKFLLPPNLIIIATANPYDRSVTDLDDALLRRFWVIELEPDGAFLRKHLQDNGVAEGMVNRALHLFNILNRAFPQGFGHTSFLGVRTIDDLAALWIGRIRLALRRIYLHDRPAFEAVEAEIEGLLKTQDDGDLDGALPPATA